MLRRRETSLPPDKALLLGPGVTEDWLSAPMIEQVKIPGNR
jgi:hypothetical protein